MVETVYCVHCGAAAKHPVTKKIDGQVLTFCCRGCLQVYEFMREEGLPAGQNEPPQASVATPPVASPTASSQRSSGPSQMVTLSIAGMTCANCVAHVERGLRSVPGVLTVSVDLAQGSAKVETLPGGVAMTDLKRAVEGAGYEVTGAGQPGGK
jgi:copper chaperone CopZ